LTARSAPDQYYPGNPPFDGEGLSRATWDEFYLISAVLSTTLAPAALSITSSVSVTVGSTTSYKTLFDSTGTEAYNWQQPLAQIGTDGIWNCPEAGLYSIDIMCLVPINTDPMWNEPISAATLQITTNVTAETFEYESVSSLPSTVKLSIIRPYVLGDTVEFELDLTRGTTSSSETVKSILNIAKIGTVR